MVGSVLEARRRREHFELFGIYYLKGVLLILGSLFWSYDHLGGRMTPLCFTGFGLEGGGVIQF